MAGNEGSADTAVPWVDAADSGKFAHRYVVGEAGWHLYGFGSTEAWIVKMHTYIHNDMVHVIDPHEINSDIRRGIVPFLKHMKTEGQYTLARENADAPLPWFYAQNLEQFAFNMDNGFFGSGVNIYEGGE